MKLNVGDKILMKKFEDLPEEIKRIREELKNDFKEKFSGKQFTVSAILKRNPIIIEIEEDEEEKEREEVLKRTFISIALGFERPISKKHFFSETYIEKVVEPDKKNKDERCYSFGWAIRNLKKGKKVARKGWNGKGIFIKLQNPDKLSKMTSPYIYIDTTGLQTDNLNAPKNRVPWVASQTDMLSNDWFEVE